MGRFREQQAALGPGKAQESAVVAPDPKLQALLAKNAVQRLLDNAHLPLQQGLAQRGFQPLLRYL